MWVRIGQWLQAMMPSHGHKQIPTSITIEKYKKKYEKKSVTPEELN